MQIIFGANCILKKTDHIMTSYSISYTNYNQDTVFCQACTMERCCTCRAKMSPLQVAEGGHDPTKFTKALRINNDPIFFIEKINKNAYNR